MAPTFKRIRIRTESGTTVYLDPSAGSGAYCTGVLGLWACNLGALKT